jgi:hypothetical protein
VDREGGLTADWRLSKSRINVRPTVRQKCHLFGLRWYQMSIWLMLPGTGGSAASQHRCISSPNMTDYWHKYKWNGRTPARRLMWALPCGGIYRADVNLAG